MTDGVDLDVETRRALEFDELLSWVASYARTEPGRRRVRAKHPSCVAELIAHELRQVAQMRALLDRDGKLLPARLPDPTPAVAALEIADLRLDARALRDLAGVAASMTAVRSRLVHLDARTFSALTPLAEGIPDLGAESRAVLDGTDPEGQIEDRASAQLARIRASSRRVTERLRRTLQRLIQDPRSESVIQDEFVTQRNGRFVIPVRVDAPHPVRGIVHASSSSGATRFVEPLETVELNNELVRLTDEEQEECGRILDVWSAAWRCRLAEVVSCLDTLTSLDDLQARALFADATRAVSPQVREAGPLRLTEARHPLLDRRLREAGSACVPIALELDPAERVLVISGPNTGGKTVALKTLGLAVLMAQTGIPVTAADAMLPLYRQVRADIGDHQSIAADLSTYSAHIRAIVDFVAASLPPALFLFDEIGTGTEPAEGAALAQAVLESLVGRRITAVATTHHGALKLWATANEATASAAMEFDSTTLQPTYRILMGAAGTSAGLAIAERLGMDSRIVAHARELLGPERLRGDAYLERLVQLVASREGEREELRRSREEIERDRVRLRERFDHEARRLERDNAVALERAVEDLRRQARREIAALEEPAARDRAQRRWTKAERRLAGAQSSHRARLAPAADGAEEPSRWSVPPDPAPGQRVHVLGLGKEGEIVAVRGERVDVQLGGIVTAVAVSDLRLPPDGAGPARAGRAAAVVRHAVDTSPDAPPLGRELRLIGQRVDAALSEIDRYLDAAVLGGLDEVRIVHGHGSGKLRSAVRRFLSGHPQVSTHRPGSESEGGNGATVAKLK